MEMSRLDPRLLRFLYHGETPKMKPPFLAPGGGSGLGCSALVLLRKAGVELRLVLKTDQISSRALRLFYSGCLHALFTGSKIGIRSGVQLQLARCR